VAQKTSPAVSPQSFTNFGDLLRYLRVRAELTQRDLAAKVGYHYSHLNRLEKNQRAPDAAMLQAHFIPALGIENEQEWASRLLELAEGKVPATQHRAAQEPTNGEDLYRLPASLISIIGRERETSLLAKLLLQPDVRLLTVVGPPGVGKTSIALHVAEKTWHHFAGGAVFVNLAPITEPARALHAIAEALGLLETSAAPSVRLLQTFLQAKELLIILDNFEQITSAAPHVADLLRTAPGVKILVTSREALRLQGEREFPLEPLPTPAEHQLNDLSLLDESPAVKLFVQRASAVQPQFSLTPENAPFVAQICRRLDGLPLALELAAARINMLSPAEMLAQFDRLFEWLTRGRRDTPIWRQTLLGATEWSYGLLTEPERLLFARLAVFSGGWALEAAEAICSDDRNLERRDILDLLSQLADRSLVVSQFESGGTRYRFLNTIHQFALVKLKESAEWDALRDAHLDYFSHWVGEVEGQLETAPPLELRSRMEADANNIRFALEWGLAGTPRLDSALRLVCAAGSVWLKHSHFKEALSWVEGYLLLAGRHPRDQMRLLFLATALSYWRDTFPQAIEYGRRGIESARALGDTNIHAAILCYLGDLYREHGDLQTAYDLAAEAAGLCENSPHQTRLSMALTCLGIIRYRMGEREVAKADIARALEIAVQANNLWAQSYALRVQADNLLFDGLFPEAFSAYERALFVSSEIDDRISVGMELANLALLANVLDDHAASDYYAQKALALFQTIGNEYQQPFPLRMLAYANIRAGDLERARGYCLESLKGNRIIGHKTGIVACLVCLAEVMLAEGNVSGAANLLRTLGSEISAHSLVLMEPDQKAFARITARLKKPKAALGAEDNIPSLDQVLNDLR
jgi:predicted ATPase/transcriptional regulator with XRE-family HTH domain